MSSVANSHTEKLNVPANNSVTIGVVGTYVRLRNATGTLIVSAYQESGQGAFADRLEMLNGDIWRTPQVPGGSGERQRFGRLIFKNETGAPITADAIIGEGDHEPSSVAGTVAVSSITPPGTLDSLADDAIGAGATELVSPAAAGKKTVIIGNLAGNASTIRVGDVGAGAANGQQVAPGQSIALDTSADVYVYSPTAQSVSVVELET